MARFMVKASEFKNVCKAVNDRKLAELKKEIIEILKKQDEKDVKKAIDYFNSQEEHYTHLEKSLISGKWIQKAGYGVGTVRIWKGKKYKKIAPGKWARVFDKEGRGTNIAIGKLIARVQKIDNVEDLMAFVMQNKQRFVDENGIDLPVLDKLRAAVDARNNGGMGSKGTSKPAVSGDDIATSLDELTAAKGGTKNIGGVKVSYTPENGYRVTHKAPTGTEITTGYDTLEEAYNNIMHKINRIKNGEIPAISGTEESEAEKTQNRSEAMKGNQNAKKYGLTDEQIERYDIQEVVEDVNGYGIVKNSEGKYSFIEDGRVKDRPDDFETDINKVKERINDANETKKNIEAAKNYDFANADFGPDVKYTKKNNGKHEFYKKDGSKAISVTIDVSDMREPLNMTYEVTDTKTGKSWQYETAYGNKEGLEWAVERPDQMEKELKKFFKRDPNKEWDKMNGESDKPKSYKTSKNDLGVTADGKEIKVTKSTDANKKIGLSKATLEDDKFIVPATKELDDTIKTMEKFFKDVDKHRVMLKGFGVKDGFLCATDGKQVTRIKIDGLDESLGDCVKIRKDGDNYIIEQDDTVETWEEETDDWSRGYKQIKKITRTADRKTQRYPNVSRVIPDDATDTMELNPDALKDVIKLLKKEKFLSASTVRSDANHYLPVVIKDGNITIDGKTVGAIPDKEIDKEMAWDFRMVENALNMGANSFNYSPEKMKEAPYMPLVASTNIGDTVFMSAAPMAKMTSYDKDSDKVVEIDKLTQHREEMARQKEKDESKRNAMYSTNKGYVDVTIESVKRSIKPDFSDKMIEKIRNMNVSDLKNLYKQSKVDLDDLMGKKDFYASTFSKYTNKNYDVSPKVLIAQNYALKQYPELVTEIEKQLEAKGEKVKKSLFDDFVMDMFIDEDEEEIEEDEENESLFNDYSAEQPELFNSTEMKVQEAFNRCNCL